MRLATLLVAFAALVSTSGGAAAQYTRACDATYGATIRGIVVNDSTGERVPDVWIHAIGGPYCRTTSDEFGRFALQRVRPGTVAIIAGSPEYRRRRIEVVVRDGDTTSVELRLVPGSDIDDCRAVPECAAILDADLALLSNDTLDLRLALLTTAIALAQHADRRQKNWHACLGDEPEELVAALRAHYPLVVSADECGPRSESGRLLENRRHMPTGSPAFQPHISAIRVIGPGRVQVGLMVSVGPRWGIGWTCRFVRVDRWRPTGCEVTAMA